MLFLRRLLIHKFAGACAFRFDSGLTASTQRRRYGPCTVHLDKIVHLYTASASHQQGRQESIPVVVANIYHKLATSVKHPHITRKVTERRHLQFAFLKEEEEKHLFYAQRLMDGYGSTCSDIVIRRLVQDYLSELTEIPLLHKNTSLCVEESKTLSSQKCSHLVPQHTIRLPAAAYLSTGLLSPWGASLSKLRCT